MQTSEGCDINLDVENEVFPKPSVTDQFTRLHEFGRHPGWSNNAVEIEVRQHARPGRNRQGQIGSSQHARLKTP